jgi:hypothetical protein
MIPRLYFDTSVFGGVYDEEFEEISTLLFEKVKLGQIICVFSDLSEAELKNAPQHVRDYFINFPKYIKLIIYFISFLVAFSF